MRTPLFLAAAFALITSCVTPRPVIEPRPAPPLVQPNTYWENPPKPVAFDRLPNWADTDFVPGLTALRESCRVFASRPEAELLSRRAPWAGTHQDWLPVCAALDVIQDSESARAVLQALLTPVEIVDRSEDARFTGYFEPTYDARRSPVHPFTEPVPGLPGDLISSNGSVLQRQRNGQLRPYPARAEITQNGVIALAYARPADVFFLQIQGSGRLTFSDGQVVRAAYAAHNGQPFRSTANWLMSRGWISRGEASMAGIKAWMTRAPEAQVREAMNANPRFVFFNLESVDDPALGPRGALGVPLSPLGSMAVDLDFHANGIPMFVQTTAPGLGGNWSSFVIAQDTGGAIKGPVRGDVFVGTGPQAGAIADTINAPGRMWVLLPRAVASRLAVSRETSQLGLYPVTP